MLFGPENSALRLDTEDAQRRVLLHLIERSAAGTVIYFPLWLVVMFSCQMHLSHPVAAGVISFLMLLVVGFRGYLWHVMHRFHWQSLSMRRIRTQLWPMMRLTVVATALLWGGLMAWMLPQHAASDYQSFIFVVLAGLCSGGISALTPSFRLSIAFISLQLFPAGLVLFAYTDQPLHGMMAVFYWLTMLMLSRSQYRHYLMAQKNEIELEQKNRTLRAQSVIDGLTGLANRSAFDKHLEHEWRRALRTQKPLSLLLIDLDHFKKLNDSHGHLIGDEALRQTGELLQHFARRPADMAARYGGEEFVLLLPDTSIDGACLQAEQLRLALQELALIADGKKIGVTASIGVSCLTPNEALSLRDLLLLADQAMYAAKDAGRNRVELAPVRAQAA